ncbi:hypothetical protein Tco_0850417, partial [Tanacetum coccineum]
MTEGTTEGRQLERGMRTKVAPGNSRSSSESAGRWRRSRDVVATVDAFGCAAAEWFRWMSRNGLITTWDRFVESVKNRFGPSKYEDPQGALSKLLQL